MSHPRFRQSVNFGQIFGRASTYTLGSIYKLLSVTNRGETGRGGEGTAGYRRVEDFAAGVECGAGDHWDGDADGEECGGWRGAESAGAE